MAQKATSKINTKKPTSRVGKVSIKKSRRFSVKQMLLVVVPLAAIGVYFVFRSFAATGTIPSTMTLIKTYKAEDLSGGQLKTKSNGLGSYRLINAKTGSYGAGALTTATVDPTLSTKVSRACVSYMSGQGTLRLQVDATSRLNEVLLSSGPGSLCTDTPGGSDATSLRVLLNNAKESDTASIISLSLYSGIEYSFIHHASPYPTDLTGKSLDVFGGDPVQADGRRYRSFVGPWEFEPPVASTHVTKEELAKTRRICLHYNYLGSDSIGIIGTTVKITEVLTDVDGRVSSVSTDAEVKLDKSGTHCQYFAPGTGMAGSSEIKYADINISVSNLTKIPFGIDTVYGHTTY